MQDVEQIIADLTVKQELIGNAITMLREYCRPPSATGSVSTKRAVSANGHKKVDWTPEKRAEQSERMKARWRKVNRAKKAAAKAAR